MIKARNLHEAIQIVNATGFGLTSGLESLDDREQQVWQEGIRAGNLYINRSTTGAIVLRQPFGGLGKSAFGPGIKAGGPNYVAQFMHFADRGTPLGSQQLADPQLQQLCDQLTDLQQDARYPPGQIAEVVAAMKSYDLHQREEFGRDHDYFRLIGQDNFCRYRPVEQLRIRIHREDTFFDIFARACAAKTAGCRSTISIPPGTHSLAITALENLTDPWAGAIEFVEESDQRLADVIGHSQCDRIRYADPARVPLRIRRTVADSGLYIADRPVLKQGRIELLWYVSEQSLSVNYHRYGNLGARASEGRSEPP